MNAIQNPKPSSKELALGSWNASFGGCFLSMAPGLLLCSWDGMGVVETRELRLRGLSRWLMGSLVAAVGEEGRAVVMGVENLKLRAGHRERQRTDMVEKRVGVIITRRTATAVGKSGGEAERTQTQC